MSRRELMPHQEIARDFIASDEGHMLVGDPGTGKTFSSIRGAQTLKARKILIHCPPIATTNWVREFALADSPLKVVDARRYPKQVPDADVVVTSIDWMRQAKAKEIAAAHRWDLQIFDEAHRGANPDAGRTQAIYSDSIRTPKTIQLTGTPTPKHAGQLWTHINRTAPERIDHMTYDAFCSRYCRIEMKILGAMRSPQPVITGNRREMIPELRTRLAGWWLRQKKDLLKLPPVVYNEVHMPASRADLRLIERDLDSDVAEMLRFAVETGDSRTLSIMSEDVSSLRRMLATVKARYTAEYAAEVMEDGVKPVALWGWHTAALQEVHAILARKGYKGALIYGATSQKARDAAQEAFQEGRLDYIVGQILAAGIAITLTATDRAIFMEESFIPSDNSQARDRHHRIGQNASLQVDRLVLAGTIDEAVAAIAARREEEFEELSSEAEGDPTK